MKNISLTVFSAFMLIGLIQLVSNQILATDKEIDGNYRFVREEIFIKTPKIETIIYDSNKWEGIWTFQNGIVSATTMNLDRKSEWFSSFPKNMSELGYNSFVGTYIFENSKLSVKKNLEINPFEVGNTRNFTVEHNGNSLIFVETLVATREALSTGTRRIFLSKITTDPNK